MSLKIDDNQHINNEFVNKYKTSCIFITLIITILWSISYMINKNSQSLIFPSFQSVSNQNEPISIKKTSVVDKIKNDKNFYNIFFDNPIQNSNAVSDDYFDDVIFIGDSLTQGLQLYKTVKQAVVISKTGLNVEILNDKLVNYNGEEITILDAIKNSNRKKIYVMLGSNGIGWLDFDYMIDKYKVFLEKIRENIPNCQIYIESVLPITATISNNQNDLTNDKINIYNNYLFNMCKQSGFYYLDISTTFKDKNGALPEEASPVDGIHLNASYYNKWIEYIKSHTVSETKHQQLIEIRNKYFN